MLKSILKPIALVAALLASCGPAHAQKAVRVDNATGQIADPANFFDANAAAISAAAPPTNTSVNAAIEDNPAATRGSLQLYDDAGKVIHVSTGDNATDTRTGLNAYDSARPFATITAAIAAATANDLIIVHPGTYKEMVTVTKNLRLHFEDGSKILVDSSIYNPGGLFPDRAFALSVPDSLECSVTGWGEFVVEVDYIGSNYTDTWGAVQYFGDGSVDFIGKRVVFNGAPTGLRPAFFTERGGSVHVNEAISDLYDAFLVSPPVPLNIHCDRAYAGDNIIEGAINGGKIEIGYAETTQNYGSGLFANFSGTAYIGFFQPNASIMTLGTIYRTLATTVVVDGSPAGVALPTYVDGPTPDLAQVRLISGGIVYLAGPTWDSTARAVFGANDAANLTTGTLTDARLPAFGGDATSTAGTATLTLSSTGVSASTYRSVTVDAKGRVTAGTNPTTIAGYGLTDAVSTSRTITAAGLATGGGDLSANRTITVTAASNTEAITGTATDRANTPASGRAALSAYVEAPMLARAANAFTPYYDGVTTDRRIYWALGTAGNVAGSPLSVVGIQFRVPTANPASSLRLFDIQATNGGPTGDNRMFSTLDTSGALNLRAISTTGNERVRIYSSFRSNYSGRLIRLTVVFASGTSAPTVYLTVAADGTSPASGRAQDITSQFSDSNSGTPPNWMDAALVSTYYSGGYNWSGDFLPGIPLNRTVTQAEELLMIEAGGLLSTDRPGGSATAVTAGSFTIGRRYRIATAGTTDFTLIGAANSTVGTEFTATGVGTGTGTATPIGALFRPVSTGTTQLGDVGPNRIRGQATAGVRIFSDTIPRMLEFSITSSGAFLTGASTNPLVLDGYRIVRAEVIVDTAGADLTFRRSSSSTNDIITAATDIPTADVFTPLTLIAAQRVMASGETLWAGLSAGTGRLIVELERN